MGDEEVEPEGIHNRGDPEIEVPIPERFNTKLLGISQLVKTVDEH